MSAQVYMHEIGLQEGSKVSQLKTAKTHEWESKRKKVTW